PTRPAHCCASSTFWTTFGARRSAGAASRDQQCFSLACRLNLAPILSKLSDAQRAEIVQRYIGGARQVALGREFKVSAMTIWKSCRADAWSLRGSPAGSRPHSSSHCDWSASQRGWPTTPRSRPDWAPDRNCAKAGCRCRSNERGWEGGVLSRLPPPI